MSEDLGFVKASLELFTETIKGIEDASLNIMKIHPINSLVMLNLMANIGYAIMEHEDFLTYRDKKYEGEGARQRLIAAIFRDSASKTASLLDGKVAKDLFSAFNLGKLIEAIKP